MTLIQRLTPEEQYRLATRFNLQPPASQPVMVFSGDYERSYTAYDLDMERQHMQELGTHAPGMPLNLARKAARRRQAVTEFAVYMLVVVGATTGTLIIAWALYMAVRGLVE